MSTTDALLVKARFLRNAAPRAYDEFLAAFGEYTAVAADILVMTTESWQLHQGHAQQCKKILKVLEEAKIG